MRPRGTACTACKQRKTGCALHNQRQRIVHMKLEGLSVIETAQTTGMQMGLALATAGAVVYALQCNEMQAPFLAVWYMLGMLIPVAVGALVGVQVLRW